MGRPERLLYAIGTFVAVVALGLPACDALHYLVMPCGQTGQFDQKTQELKNKERMDGLWALQTIDGKPIPAGGYALPEINPLKPVKYLRSGHLVFTTTTANFTDDCGKLRSSDGTAAANYDLTVSGTTRHKTYPGRFWADHEAHTATLGAGEYLLPIDVKGSPPNTMTARAEIGEFGIGTTYILVFKR